MCDLRGRQAAAGLEAGRIERSWMAALARWAGQLMKARAAAIRGEIGELRILQREDAEVRAGLALCKRHPLFARSEHHGGPATIVSLVSTEVSPVQPNSLCRYHVAPTPFCLPWTFDVGRYSTSLVCLGWVKLTQISFNRVFIGDQPQKRAVQSEKWRWPEQKMAWAGTFGACLRHSLSPSLSPYRTLFYSPHCHRHNGQNVRPFPRRATSTNPFRQTCLTKLKPRPWPPKRMLPSVPSRGGVRR